MAWFIVENRFSLDNRDERLDYITQWHYDFLNVSFDPRHVVVPKVCQSYITSLLSVTGCLKRHRSLKRSFSTTSGPLRLKNLDSIM